MLTSGMSRWFLTNSGTESSREHYLCSSTTPKFEVKRPETSGYSNDCMAMSPHPLGPLNRRLQTLQGGLHPLGQGRRPSRDLGDGVVGKG